MLIFNYICDEIVSLFLWYLWSQWFPHMVDPMVMSILYVWCQINRDEVVIFWFGDQFKAMYLPWVLFGLNFLFLLSKNSLAV